MVFYHLILNEIKFNNKPKPKIVVAHKTGTDFHTFSVIDNGIGIDIAHSEKVSILFQRLHSKNA